MADNRDPMLAATEKLREAWGQLTSEESRTAPFFRTSRKANYNGMWLAEKCQETWIYMSHRGRLFVVYMSLAQLATGVIAYLGYTHVAPDVLDALLAGLLGGSVLIAAAAGMGIAAALNPHEPLPNWGRVLSGMVFAIGLVRACWFMFVVTAETWF